MKQTNNAIKFLMAQYRAIFKNANIAMLAAMAAAALAAGQAQADDLTVTNWGDATGDTITVGGTSPTYGKIDLTAAADEDKANNNSFKLTIKGGDENKINGAATDKGSFTAAKGTLVIEGADAAGTKLIIGDTQGAKATFGTVSVNKGTVDLKKGTLTAGTINLGVEGTAAGTYVAIVDIAGGTLGNKADDAQKIAASTINILDGAKVSGKAATSTIAGKVVMTGGELISDNTQKLIIDGTLNATGGKLTNSGSLVLNGDATFGGELTLDNKGAIDFAGAKKGETQTLTVTKDIFENKLFKDGGMVSGAGTAGANYKIKVDGTTDKSAVDLTKLFSNDGAIDNNDFNFTAGNRIVEADHATFGNGKYDATVQLTVGNLTAGKNNAFSIDKGVVEVKNSLKVDGLADNGVLTAKSGSLVLNGTGAEHEVLAKSIVLNADTNNADAAKLNVTGGTWSVNDLTLTKGRATVDSGSKLVINGELTTTTRTSATDGGLLTIKGASYVDASGAKKLTLVSGGSGFEKTVSVESGSTLELNAKQVFSLSGETATLTDGSGTGEHKVELKSIATDKTSTLMFDTTGWDNFEITENQYKSLIEKLGTNTAVAGFISFIDASGNAIGLKGMSSESKIELDKVLPGDIYNGATGTTATGNLDKSVFLGNINVTTDSGSLAIANDTASVLYKADKDGHLVSNNKGAANVVLSGTANLTLAGQGDVGAIDSDTTATGTLNIGYSSKEAGVVTAKTVGADKGIASLNIQKGGLVLTAKKEADTDPEVQLKTNKLSLAQGTSLTAKGQAIVVSSAAQTGSAEIFGDLTAKSLTLNTSGGKATTFNIAKGALVDVDALTLQQSGSLFVGENDGTTTSSATLEVGKLTLAKGSLIVDPAMTDTASIAAVKDLSAKDSNGDAQVLDGKIAVGQNSAVGIGFDTRAEVEQVLTQAGLMADHKFINTPESVKGALILNNAINVASGNGVLIDTSKTAADLSTGVTADKFQMAGNAALIVNDSVYKRVNGKLEGVAVTLANGAANSVTADATSKVILNGDFDANDAGVQIFAGSGPTVNAVSGDIAFETANGVLSGKIDSKGQIGSITVDKTKLDSKFLTVSAPVRDLLKTAIMNQGGVIDKGQIGGKFLSQVANNITDSSGVAADAAAHAATYAGAQQAAVVSVTTMADAMFGRVGAVGVEAASIAATGSQANGGVWLTPMYKSMDADGFNAEGASYGSDVDAAGVAFGADTVNGNMRFGAVFNIGSGDAEGKGNGNGLKDEFDYYGFGIYSAMGFGNFALVGDASMTVISHEVEGLGLKGKADTTAVTMGVTGQYTVATPAVDVTPHLGARFIRLNTDSYDLTSANGVVGTTDFDVQNVFSVPLGVTLSKAFVAGGWSLAPSADLTIAFNTGDTDANSTTRFTGINQNLDLTAEVLDEVQYGLTVGLGAQYGAFGTSFGINYTGSENTDAFGVNAQCRYMF
ncbi:autotransporter outer membrane beta-barrel domain-containing protein [uncultured Anaerobiospirillum sp.]|uniref:autotransporter outer membrane beta-barrel domain-containing protein n=1 Tax=uncultured Anaerobiospirillum sp. TaxID=265728 RepID=UPI0028048A64|nr:autotransporter outer membrane beta-barrel domain-containing protein [uncultured Anaerobiospirillum sp.]